MVSSVLIPFHVPYCHVPFCHVQAFSCKSLHLDGSVMVFSSYMYMYVEQKALRLEAKGYKAPTYDSHAAS